MYGAGGGGEYCDCVIYADAGRRSRLMSTRGVSWVCTSTGVPLRGGGLQFAVYNLQGVNLQGVISGIRSSLRVVSLVYVRRRLYDF